MKLKTLFLGLLAAALGYSVFWFYLSWNMGIFLETAAKELEEKGVQLSFDNYEVSGFPYRLEVVLRNVTVIGENGPLSWSFQSPQLEAVTHPWSFKHLILFPETAVFTFGEDASSQAAFRPRKTEASLVNQTSEGFRLSMVLEEIEVLVQNNEPLPTSFKTLNLHIREQARDLEYALDGEINDSAKFQLSGQVKNGIPMFNRKDLRTWVQEGGQLDIGNFRFLNANEILDASGSFSLDQNFYPEGSLDIQTNSPGAALSLFQVFGLISEEDAAGVRFFLGALPFNPEQDQTLPLALVANEGALFLGPFQLKKLTPVIQE